MEILFRVLLSVVSLSTWLPPAPGWPWRLFPHVVKSTISCKSVIKPVCLSAFVRLCLCVFVFVFLLLFVFCFWFFVCLLALDYSIDLF